MSPACPSEEQLLRLVQGQISGAEVAILHEHMDRCDDCREFTAALVTNSDQGEGQPALDQTIPTLEYTPDREARGAAALDQASLIGQVLKQCYRIERLLGQGAMGAVYQAVHLRLSAQVAVKVLHAAAVSPQILSRFRREAKILSALRHQNVVRVMDYDQMADGRPYVVMELLEGEDLGTRLRRRGRLHFAEVLALARAIGGGLTEVHTHGIVHRDLKPQNIFLARRMQGAATTETPVLVDFGISKVEHGYADLYRSLDRQFSGTFPPGGKAGWSQEMHQTMERQVLGTPYYMTPEQAIGNNDQVDHRADQWALAAILYECLTGCKAFPGDDLMTILMRVQDSEPPPLRTLAPAVPEPAEGAIRRALSKTRDQRFPSIDEFLAALSMQARPAVATSRRRFSLMLAAAAMLLLLLGVAASQSIAPGRPQAAPVTPPGAPLSTKQGPSADPPPLAPGIPPRVLARLPPFRLAGDRPVSPPPSGSRRPPERSRPAAAVAPALIEQQPQAPGYLDIYVEPWAEVTLDGSRLDRPTPLQGVKVPAGLHELVLNNPVLKRSRVVKVRVTEGETRKVEIYLDR